MHFLTWAWRNRIFSERRRYILRVIQPSTCSTLGEYDSCPPLARYVWYFTSYLRSSCCSETHVRPRLLPVFLPLSTLDVTHVRKCTRPSPLYRTASDEKLGDGLGKRLPKQPVGICKVMPQDICHLTVHLIQYCEALSIFGISSVVTLYQLQLLNCNCKYTRSQEGGSRQCGTAVGSRGNHQ